jgi:hypothetical protein
MTRPALSPHPRNLWPRFPLSGTHGHRLGGWTSHPRNRWPRLPLSGRDGHRFGGWGS